MRFRVLRCTSRVYNRQQVARYQGLSATLSLWSEGYRSARAKGIQQAPPPGISSLRSDTVSYAVSR